MNAQGIGVMLRTCRSRSHRLRSTTRTGRGSSRPSARGSSPCSRRGSTAAFTTSARRPCRGSRRSRSSTCSRACATSARPRPRSSRSARSAISPTRTGPRRMRSRPGDGGWWEQTHHLHLTEPGSDLWRERLAFRDALRADPALAAEYERWKVAHAAQTRRPRPRTPKPRPLVAGVLARAGIELGPDAERRSLSSSSRRFRRAPRSAPLAQLRPAGVVPPSQSVVEPATAPARG